MDSQPPLHLARIENGIGDFAEIRWLVQPQIVRAVIARVVRLEVVKDVGELHGELDADAFTYLNVLREGRVHVPTLQAPKVARAAATRVDAENASPKHIKYGGGVSEHVDAFRVVCAYAV